MALGVQFVELLVRVCYDDSCWTQQVGMYIGMSHHSTNGELADPCCSIRLCKFLVQNV